MRSILICPGETLKDQFTEAAARHSNLVLSKVLNEYPSGHQLRQIICLCAPEVVFLDIEDAEAAEGIARHLAKDFPSIQRIALHHSQDPAIFRRVLQLRMRELLSPPFSAREIGPILDSLEEELRVHPATIGATEHVYAFLPAKSRHGSFDDRRQRDVGLWPNPR